jgi:hypothetical protein
MNALIEQVLSIPLPLRISVLLLILSIISPFHFRRVSSALIWLITKVILYFILAFVNLILYLEYIIVGQLRRLNLDVPRIFYVLEILLSRATYLADKAHNGAKRFMISSSKVDYKIPRLWFWVVTCIFLLLWVFKSMQDSGANSHFIQKIYSLLKQGSSPLSDDGPACSRYKSRINSPSSTDLEVIDQRFYEETGVQLLTPDASPELKEKWCKVAEDYLQQ